MEKEQKYYDIILKRAGFSAQKLNRRTKEKSIKNERWQKWF